MRSLTSTLTSYVTFSAFVLGIGLPGPAAAQTPLSTIAPKLELKWLGTLTLSPATHYVSPSAGGQVTGTLTLLRPAIKDMTVTLWMAGATPAEGPFQLADGVALPYSVPIRAGDSQGTFPIITAKATWWGTKQYTVNAALGSERVSASFTVMTRK